MRLWLDIGEPLHANPGGASALPDAARAKGARAARSDEELSLVHGHLGTREATAHMSRETPGMRNFVIYGIAITVIAETLP